LKKHIKTVLSLSAIPLLISACSTTTPTNIAKIEKNKHANLKNNIHISEPNGYKAYINDNNQLTYLCYQGDTGKCNHQTYKKHSYNDGRPLEETFWVNSNGYFPPVSPSTKDVKCGTGSLFGWLSIFNVEPFGIKDYDKQNPVVCNSRFTEIDSTLMGARVAIGLVTFMTPLVTGGTIHTVKFDDDTFKEAVYISNIETFKKQLFDLTHKYNIKGGLDVIYLEQGSVLDNLEDKYELLLNDKSKKAGIIFLEENTNRLLSINIFDKYKNENLITSISLQIRDLLNDIARSNQYMLKYDDIVPYIPAEISLPEIPPVPVLIKDEFETKSDFKKRVEKAVEEREKQIRDLQRQYSLDVFERNAYIDSLQRSYQQYLKQKSEEKINFLKELKNNIPLLSKVLFLENTSGYSAKDFKYNAETQRLYCNIYSKNRGFNQEVVAEIPPNIAKQIKLQKTFKIIPEIEAQNNKILLLGFDILETTSDNIYKTKYTDINFRPEEVRVSVVGMKESIKKSVSNYFKKYKQKDMPIVDTSKKEIWYIDIAKSINAKVPKWFSSPSSNNKIIGYGEGKTLAQAKANARNDLSFMVKVKVNTLFENTTNINNFKSFSEVKQQTKQSSDIELSSSDYRVYKQDNIDGKWYVGLEYLK